MGLKWGGRVEVRKYKSHKKNGPAIIWWLILAGLGVAAYVFNALGGKIERIP